jgi:hypothetical protein
MSNKINANHSSGISAHVQDQQKLQLFRKKRGEWFELFEGQNAEGLTIQRQLHDAIIQDLTYRVLTTEANRNPVGQGYAIPSVLYLLNVGYMMSQCLAARRMLDERKDVASLIRVLKDVRKHNKLITRECFVAYDGTPYDHDLSSIHQDDDDKLQFAIYRLQAPTFAPQLRSFHRHERFDKLSKGGHKGRSRIDVIDASVFEKVESWTRSSEALRLKAASDERFAHAGDGRNSQRKRTTDNISLKEIERALQGFVRASRGLFDIVLNSEVHGDVVPFLPLGAFGTVWKDSELIPSTDRMQRQWDQLAENRNTWWHGIEGELDVSTQL